MQKYDKKYTFGNTTVYVVAPKITEEEKTKRWETVCNIAAAIINEIQKKARKNMYLEV